MANSLAANFLFLITNMRILFSSIIGILLLMTSCSVSSTLRDDRSLMHDAVPETFSARLVLRVLREEGDRKVLAIVVQNTDRLPIQSVRAWVRFDPMELKASDLTMEDGRFALFAPGEREIDSVSGFIKIGAAAREPVSDDLATLATFTIQSSAKPVLTFYDWREEGDGHAAILTLKDGKASNILTAPPAIEL